MRTDFLPGPAVRRALAAALGPEPAGTSPHQYAAFIKSEIDKDARIVKILGLQPE